MNNSNKNIRYLYKIVNIITNKIYIGQTCNFKQRKASYKYKSKKETQKLIHRSINKYGWDNHRFEVFCTCISELVDQLEIYFIKHFNSYHKNNKLGLNLTEGGPTSLKGKDNASYGIKKSKEHLEKIAIKNRKSVDQYSIDGKLIKTWKSIKDAYKELKISHISECCQRRVNKAGNFIWRYTGDNDLKYNPNKYYKGVIQLSLDNIPINVFKSLIEAKRITGVNNTCILNVCKGKQKTAGGFKWKYSN